MPTASCSAARTAWTGSRTSAGRDRIEILDGARRFYQLDIEKAGSDVRVSFDDTVILVEDVALRSIGAEDFIF